MVTSFKRVFLTTIVVLGIAGPQAFAGSYLVDFEGYEHGRIINTQEAGLTISAVNRGGGPDLAVAFDSELRGTRDPDLEGPNGADGAWSRGNLPTDTRLGNILIIQENSRGIEDGIADRPDDEGSRPAGSLYFDFDQAVDSFGFDLVDVEGVEEYGQDRGYFATFFSAAGSVIVGFSDLVTPGGQFYDPNIAFGNRSANRIDPITAQQLGLDSFQRVEINLGGSAGVDNVRFTHAVPTPTALGGGVLLGLAMLMRRRHAKEG